MAEKILAACGNDCAVCPRYSPKNAPKTPEELHHTAELWYKIGYRDCVVTNEEIACTGCRPENWCRYRVITCCVSHGIENCGLCADFPCANLEEAFRVTQEFEPQCRAVCNQAEYEMFKRAFFEKRENLEAVKSAGSVIVGDKR